MFVGTKRVVFTGLPEKAKKIVVLVRQGPVAAL
jgi:hypothetical protein